MLKQPQSQLADLGGYSVRPAQSDAEMAQVMALRRARFGVAEDRFDASSAQIMVQYQGDLLATFRLRSYASTEDLAQGYTGQLYDLRALQRMGGPALELGRFCAGDAARQTDALRLCFAAMAARVDALGAGLLFGCSSFQGQDLAQHRPAFSLLKRYVNHTIPVRSIGAQYVDLDEFSHSPAEEGGALRALPPLLRSYLALGGWVGGQAVRDDALGTFHVFTALPIALIPPARAQALRVLAAQIAQV